MREKIALYSPQWEGPIKGWARACITKNKWRCDPILDTDDLMQDAYLVFLKLVKHYPSVREARHFMALYKTALNNEMHNYARVMRDRPVTVEDGDCVEYTNWGYVAAALAEAPEELKLALAVYADEGKRKELASDPVRPRFSRKNLVPRETLSQKLCRLGAVEHFDVASAIRRLFA